MQNKFYLEMKDLLDGMAHDVYRVTKKFPSDELYGITSQLRRATISVVLNYIEGYARQREKVFKNFLEISYGSLQEAKYLLDFSLKEGYLSIEEHVSIMQKAEKAGAMAWGTLKRLS